MKPNAIRQRFQRRHRQDSRQDSRRSLRERSSFIGSLNSEANNRAGGFWLLACLLFSILPGCSAYRIGPQTLFRADVRTIHVPMVRSNSLRPELGVRLTEAIQKRIEERTPYKIVDDLSADSTLQCRLTTDSKTVMAETRTDEPRQLRTFLTVESAWTNRRGQVLMENRFLPPGETAFYFAQASDFVPEAGQSITTAHQRAIERLADHIVDQMEARW
jgi:hypothetical protein